MSDRTNAQILQVLRRQPRQNRIIDLILSECGLVSFEAKTPQPTLDVHEDVALAQLPVCNHLPGETTCLGDRDDRYGSFGDHLTVQAAPQVHPQQRPRSQRYPVTAATCQE